jgi:FKBP-type peptidyl-prolyl cis-trans isomerase
MILTAAAASACKPQAIKIEETPISVRRETQGAGGAVQPGDTVRVSYRLALPDGREVLNQRGYRFVVGTDTVIRGIDDAVVGMRPGGTRHFTCPPHLHWGRAGYGNVVPPATDLEITLTLEQIEARAQRRAAAD